VLPGRGLTAKTDDTDSKWLLTEVLSFLLIGAVPCSRHIRLLGSSGFSN